MRPISTYPRGEASGCADSSSNLILECPRVSPEWDFAARLALVKPKPYTKQKIEHSKAVQPWPRNARRKVEAVLAGRRRTARATFPSRGEARLRVEFVGVEIGIAMRVARKLSRALPTLWFTLGDRCLRDGVLYRRVGKYKLELVRATRVRLRRSIRMGFLEDVDDAGTRDRQTAGKDAERGVARLPEHALLGVQRLLVVD